MIELLILDFEGVCTFSASEAVDRALDPGDLASSIRPEAPAVVRQAQGGGAAVAILSNELSPDWSETVELLRLVDYVVCCADNGIYKPDRRAFQRCLLLTGAVAEHTLVVDDDRDNIAVADSLGMATVHFDAGVEHRWDAVRKSLS